MGPHMDVAVFLFDAFIMALTLRLAAPRSVSTERSAEEVRCKRRKTRQWNDVTHTCDACLLCGPCAKASKPCGGMNGGQLGGVCLACRNGTYSSTYSTDSACLSWRDCDRDNRRTVQEGTCQANRICGRCKPGFDDPGDINQFCPESYHLPTPSATPVKLDADPSGTASGYMVLFAAVTVAALAVAVVGVAFWKTRRRRAANTPISGNPIDTRVQLDVLAVTQPLVTPDNPHDSWESGFHSQPLGPRSSPESVTRSNRVYSSIESVNTLPDVQSVRDSERVVPGGSAPASPSVDRYAGGNVDDVPAPIYNITNNITTIVNMAQEEATNVPREEATLERSESVHTVIMHQDQTEDNLPRGGVAETEVTAPMHDNTQLPSTVSLAQWRS